MGFLSKSSKILNITKGRHIDKPLIQEVAELRDISSRIPKKFRKMVRNSQKITYMTPNNKSYRVATNDTIHKGFLENIGVVYSTSANKTDKNFDENWSKSKADIVVYEKQGFKELKSSSIIKLYKNNIKRIR